MDVNKAANMNEHMIALRARQRNRAVYIVDADTHARLAAVLASWQGVEP